MTVPGLDKKVDPQALSAEVQLDKPEEVHTEFTMLDDEKGTSEEPVDYSGAHEKTDPAEAKLVRQLDLWIMPTSWFMYWLSYLNPNAIDLARLDDLEEDLKLSSTH